MAGTVGINRLRSAAVSCALVWGAGGCALEPQAPEEVPPKPTPPEGSNRGKVGDSIRLAGGQAAIRVRLIRVLDPAPATPADTTLAKGARFVGVELELTNVGEAHYSESPVGGAQLLDARGREADPVSLLGGPCAGRFGSHVEIAPGAKRRGCIAFEVRGSGPLSLFRFNLASGFAEEVGEWRLK